MKKIITLSIALALTLLAGSCDDFLEHEPYG